MIKWLNKKFNSLIQFNSYCLNLQWINMGKVNGLEDHEGIAAELKQGASVSKSSLTNASSSILFDSTPNSGRSRSPATLRPRSVDLPYSTIVPWENKMDSEHYWLLVCFFPHSFSRSFHRFSPSFAICQRLDDPERSSQSVGASSQLSSVAPPSHRRKDVCFPCFQLANRWS